MILPNSTLTRVEFGVFISGINVGEVRDLLTGQY